MFPVPDHLPKTGGDHLSSDDRPPPDPTLDLLQPLVDGLSPSASAGAKASVPTSATARISSQDVKGVRSKLEDAIQQNKTRAHELLREDYPSVSSHIRLGDQVRQDFGRISTQVSQLEGLVDHSDAETSFLPPVLATLDRHFTAVQARAAAQAHIQALRRVAEDVGRLQRLEEAIWAGRGADDWVMRELVSIQTPDAALEGTRLSREISARYALLKAMVIEQLSDSFKSAVTFTTAQNGAVTLTVHSKASLQQPKLDRPEKIGSPSRPSKPPPYSLAHIYSSLAKMESLDPLIHSLQTRLIRDVVTPVTTTQSQLSISEPDSVHELSLGSIASLLPPSERIDAVSRTLDFIGDHVFPSIPDLDSARRDFLSHIHQASMNLIVQDIILPAMPSSLGSIPDWLAVVNHAVSVESQHADGTPLIITPFFQSEAGKAWAVQRRKRVAEDVRKIIVGGWGGWEAVAEERDKDVITLVEVEVSDDEGDIEPVPENGADNDKGEEDHRGKLSSKGSPAEDEDFGWGFNDSPESKVPKEGATDSSEPVDEGWGFDESDNVTAGPSSTVKANGNDSSREQSTSGGNGGPMDEGDGWDFEMDAGDPTPASLPAPIAKPAREAKRLGKKVAKAKMEVEDDPWASEPDSAQGSSSAGRAKVVHPEAITPDSSSQPLDVSSAPKDDWSWGDAEAEPASAPKTKSRVKKKRKVLREEKKTIKETFLISRACEKIVDVAERTLREAFDLRQKDLLSPSFDSAYEFLLDAATDVFDIYRSLLPSHFAAQVRDVPVLAMQLHNDARHLVRRVTKLGEEYPQWLASSQDGREGLSQRLNALADHAFETQLSIQNQSLMEGLEEARFDDVARDIGQKNAERALNGVVHKLDTLSRVLRVVLPATMYLTVLGYLLDETVQKILADILGLQDITEVESSRLSDLLKLIYPLEEIFILEPGQPSTVVAQVPHWLKFCYISELLNASLVDILYLFDSGALIDFTTDELVNLVRALFSDSEKRDKAIGRIEIGPQLGGPSPEAPV